MQEIRSRVDCSYLNPNLLPILILNNTSKCIFCTMHILYNDKEIKLFFTQTFYKHYDF